MDAASFVSDDEFPPSMVEPCTATSLLQAQQIPDGLLAAIASNNYTYPNVGYSSLVPPLLPAMYEEFMVGMDGLTEYAGIDTEGGPSTSTSSCPFLDSGIGGVVYGGGMSTIPVCGQGQGQGQGFFTGSGMMVEAGPLQEIVYHCGIESSMHHGYNLQVPGERQQQPLASDQSTLDDSTFKVGRLSAEERKEKIHRYIKKRNERNFSKKIKYACRKTLADSRPRVRGRFAKNEEFGEAARPGSVNNVYYDDELVVKEEDIFDSSDILAHISGVNSFSYKYTVESWI